MPKLLVVSAFLLSCVLAIAPQAHAQMKIVRPSLGDNSSDVKFTGSPQTEAIRDAQLRVQALEVRVKKLEEQLTEAKQLIDQLNEAARNQAQEILSQRDLIRNNSMINQNILSCAVNRQLFDGGVCVRAIPERGQ